MSFPSQCPSSSSTTTTTTTTSSSSPSSGPRHKWTSFEVHALISLIIKGEHHICSKDPMYFTERLNNIVNPAGATTTTKTFAHNEDDDDDRGDIPHAEVQKMLVTVVTKKKHAVDISERHPTNVLTRRKMRAFVRNNLRFAGGHPKGVIRNRRERNLLVNWGIGPSFLDDDQDISTPESPERRSLTDADTFPPPPAAAAGSSPGPENPTI